MGSKSKSHRKSKTNSGSESVDNRFDTRNKPQFGQPKEKKGETSEKDDRFVLPADESVIPDKYGRKKKTKKTKEVDNAHESDSGNDDPLERQTEPKLSDDPSSRIAYLTALSRGQIAMSDSSSRSSDDENDSSDDDNDSDKEDMTVGILDPSHQAPALSQVVDDTISSRHVAICNMDWTSIRAVDVYALCMSFASVEHVAVLPSNFGRERMAQELKSGPPNDLWKEAKEAKESENEVEDEDDEDSQASAPNEITPTPFDAEKLRAYEASKLRYYFAVVTCRDEASADVLCKELDGMEWEHSSAALDVSLIPTVQDVLEDRPVRDEASNIPSNYTPPDSVVAALQQTNVSCTWEEGDKERERVLTTRFTAEPDDLKAYLASDVSSDEEVDDEEKKGSMRKLLGLDSDEDDEQEDQHVEDDDFFQVNDDADDNVNENKKSQLLGDDDDSVGDKEFTFVPGQASKLQDKIQSKLRKEEKGDRELTPWEKYQEKRKQKKRERRQAAREKQRELKEMREQGGKKNKAIAVEATGEAMTKDELELLVAGDDEEEEKRDYDMRDIRKGEKEAKKRKNAVPSTDEFEVDTADDRFKAVLDGQDDRFGIDRTDPSFKETRNMEKILSEQTKRRKKKRRDVAIDASAEDLESKKGQPSAGAAALSALVSRLKSNATNR